jgi:branched-chain amino acid transport system substrate-binding protein
MTTQLTGSGSEMGINLRDGFMLAVDEVNNSGGINGRKIEVMIRDTQATPTVGITVAQDLVNRSNVIAVVGCANSPVIMANMAVTSEAKTPQLAFGMLQAILEQGNNYIFRMTPGDKVMAEHMVNYLKTELKATRIAILHDSSDYGRGGRKIVLEKLDGAGYKPVTEQSFDVGDVDFTAQLLNIQRAQADAIILWGLYVEGAQIMRQAKTMGVNIPVIASSGVLQGPFTKLAGDAAEGVRVTTYFATDDPDPSTQNMIKAYAKRYGKNPDPVAATAYDVALLLINAWKSGTGYNRETLTKYLTELKYFRGATGEYWADGTGQLNRFTVLLQVKDGALKTIWTSKKTQK